MDILNSLNLRGSRRSFFLVSSIALTLSACGGGGGGGDPGPGPGVTPPIGSVVLTEDQAAFEKTVFPLLTENCSECHSETSNLAHIAHSDVVNAHSVVTNGNFVDLQSPSSSRLVIRVAQDGHNCWTASCAADGDTMAAAIAQWNNDGGTGGDPIEPPVVEPPVVEPPVVEPPAGISSPDAFAQSLHPLVEQHCGSCHDGSLALAAFAGPDSQTSHDVMLDKKLANLQNPGVSAVVTFLSVQDHNCWSADCQADASVLEDAVARWQQLIEGSSVIRDNRPPVANVDSYTTQVNIPLRTESLLLNDSDPDNDILGISAFDETSSQGGAVVNNLNGTFTYTPANGFVGTDTFTYTISDEKGGFDTATVTISVIQPAIPVARADLVKTNKDTSVIISTLVDNDTSASGNPLVIVSVDTLSSEGGSVVLNTSDSSVTYTPTANFSGSDSFNYTISDGQGIATAKVTVDINTSPIAVSDAVYTYVDLEVNTGSVIANDLDSNGDTLTVTGFDNASVQSGSVVVNADGISFTYTPPDNIADSNGNDSFDYIIDDGRGGSASATVFIAVTDPILADDNRFLAFLNQSAELFSESAETAAAYYRAVDPLDQRTTLEDWRNLNGFNIGADAQTIYINENDLGFSRVMFVRTDLTTGVISSYVENYDNLEAAKAAEAAQNQVGVIATVAMEYTVAPGRNFDDPDAPRYMTFYVFDGNNNRALSADLDGAGQKFIPGLCNTCHGGRPKALVNGVYPDGGDTGAGFIPWDVDTFGFADATDSVDREEDVFKIFNQAVLDTNPFPAVKEAVEGWYGGPGLPSKEFNPNFVPLGWLPPAAPEFATQLYTQSVAPSCRACHIMLGSPLQNDIDFTSYDKFMSYKARIETMVYDEGTMPLAKRTWDRFWANPVIPETMARLMDSSKILENDEVLSPGRPIANAGPVREAAFGRVDLNGNASVFTAGVDAFSWTLVSRPANSVAVIENADQADAFFVADEIGDYVVQLVVNDEQIATPPSPPAETVIRVLEDSRGTSFTTNIKPIFDVCAVCHLGLDNPDFGNARTLYDNLVDFVNADDPVNSPILVKPSGQHHGGGIIQGFESVEGKSYKTMLQWILEGAPDN